MADCLIEMISRKARSHLVQQLLLTPPLTSTERIDAITFSGGVSEFVYQREERDFGDLSWPLARALQARIAHHDLPAPDQAAGERIRATVIGASQFTVQVSGNTIAVADPAALPIHNLQVLYPRLPTGDGVEPDQLSAAIASAFQRFDLVEGDQPIALALNWTGVPELPIAARAGQRDYPGPAQDHCRGSPAGAGFRPRLWQAGRRYSPSGAWRTQQRDLD